MFFERGRSLAFVRVKPTHDFLCPELPSSARVFVKRTARLLIALFLCSTFLFPQNAAAGFASSITLSLGEEYNDNIFFSNERNSRGKCDVCDVSDFITHFVPTFELLYVPPSGITPTFTARLTPSGQIYAKNSELNNFGDNLSFDSGYTYRYSPRLTFHATDSLFRGGGTRTVGLEALGSAPPLPNTPSSFPATGSFITLPMGQDIGGLVSKGRTIANYFTLNGAYLYAPNVTLSAGYGLAYSSFASGDSSDLTHSVGVRAIYNWRPEHNLHAGYSATFLSSRNRNGGSSVIHNFDFGDDYFSLFKFQLAPTLTLSATTGISVNIGGGGPQVGNNSGLTLVKVWETAIANVSFRRGLSTGFATSGPAEATTFAGGYGIRLTDRLSVLVGGDFNLVDSEDVNYKVFRAGGGAQYWLTTWLSAHMWYNHRFRDIGSGANNTDNLTKGKISGNSVFLGLGMHFDVYPNLSFARGLTHPLYSPPGAPPFATPAFPERGAPEPATPQPGTPGIVPPAPSRSP